jgi:excisionase family DNA binding protein
MTANSAEYLVSEETATLLRTPLATLYRWRHEGTGPPARRVGKRLLYRRDEVIAWVESRTDLPSGSDQSQRSRRKAS